VVPPMTWNRTLNASSRDGHSKFTEKYNPGARPRSTEPLGMLLQSRRLRGPSGKPVIARCPTLPGRSAFGARTTCHSTPLRGGNSRFLRPRRSLPGGPLPPARNATLRNRGHLSRPISRSRPTSFQFPVVLNLVEEKAPARFAEAANALRNSSADSWTNLLTHTWSEAGNPPILPRNSLAFAFPSTVRRIGPHPRSDATRRRHAFPVPFCNRKPAMAVLRPQGDGARRNLVCGFCLVMGISPHRLCRMWARKTSPSFRFTPLSNFLTCASSAATPVTLTHSRS